MDLLLPPLLLMATSVAPVLATHAPTDTIQLRQVEASVEAIVTFPGPGVGEVYFEEAGQRSRPYRVGVGENRLNYEVLQTGAPLAERTLVVELFDQSGGLVAEASVRVVEPLDLPSHSLLSLTPFDQRVLRKRWLLEERAGITLGNLLAETDVELAQPVVVPNKGGTWSNAYRCPDHGVILEHLTLTQHKCPIDGQVWMGEEFDRALAVFLHLQAADEAWRHALAFSLDQDPDHAARVHEILSRYASIYPNFPQHDEQGNPSPTGGKAFGQTLDEAQWLIDLARAFDLLRGTGTFTAWEEEEIREKVLRPAMEIVLGNDLGINNIQCWHNTAAFLAALLVGDPVTADQAMRGTTGFGPQLELGVDPDGLWYEGTFGYHYFTYRALLPMMQAAQRAGVELPEQDRVRLMLEMPWHAALPDGSLVMMNDGAYQSFADNLLNDYEQGLAFWPNPTLSAPMAKYGRGKSTESVVFGVADLPFVDWMPLGPENFTGTGLAALRSVGQADPSMILMDYGEHGGFHGHPDKLGITAWLNGYPVLQEAGAVGYGLDAADGYFKRSLAHNTVLIDGHDQVASSGRFRGYWSNGEDSWLLASADEAYAATSFRRQIANVKAKLVDGVEVIAPQTVVMDYVLHSPETISHTYTTSSASLGYTGPYDYLSQVRELTVSGAPQFRFGGPLGEATVDLLPIPGARYFIARAPGFPLPTMHEVLIVRVQAQRAVFAATITENGAVADGFEISLDDKPGDPALLLRLSGGAPFRLPFYP